jgi:RNA polymerase sigma-32 factor
MPRSSRQPPAGVPYVGATPQRTACPALSRTDPLQAYLREIQRYPLLTPEQEQKMTRHYVDTQDVQTAARLVTANLRLVVKLAYEYRRAYKNIMDLIQEGNIGLMQAVKRYDPYRGVKLSSYAAWWIRAYILRFILNNWRLVKLGTTQAQRKLFFNLNKEKAKLAALGIEPRRRSPSASASRRRRSSTWTAASRARGERSTRPSGDADGRASRASTCSRRRPAGPTTCLERREMGSSCTSASGSSARRSRARTSSSSTSAWPPKTR